MILAARVADDMAQNLEERVRDSLFFCWLKNPLVITIDNKNCYRPDWCVHFCYIFKKFNKKSVCILTFLKIFCKL